MMPLEENKNVAFCDKFILSERAKGDEPQP